MASYDAARATSGRPWAGEVEALRRTPPATDDNDVHLECRLMLIKCLIERLDKRSVGSKAAGLGLVQVLMYRCLFPEAVPVLNPPQEVGLSHPSHLPTLV